MCTPQFMQSMGTAMQQSGLTPTVSPVIQAPGSNQLIQPQAHPVYDPNFKPTPIKVPLIGAQAAEDPNQQVNVTWAPYNPASGMQMGFPGGMVGPSNLPNQGKGWTGTETRAQLNDQWSYGGLSGTQYAPPPGTPGAAAAATQASPVDLGALSPEEQAQRRAQAQAALSPYYANPWAPAGDSGGGGGSY